MKTSFLVLLVSLGLLIGLLWALAPPREVRYEDLPWQVESLPDGRSRVFGITLGASTLDELREKLKVFPSMGLFAASDGDMSIEAYFGTVTLGPFEANVLAVLDADPATLTGFAQRAVNHRPMPSGARRMDLSESDMEHALRLTVRELAYAPRARYDAEVISRRFGEPAERLRMDERRSYWLYPEKGLALMFDERGRELLHYVTPSDFAGIRERLFAGPRGLSQ
jgi:hypothetical protein